jgi:hypothetical protein
LEVAAGIRHQVPRGCNVLSPCRHGMPGCCRGVSTCCDGQMQRTRLGAPASRRHMKSIAGWKPAFPSLARFLVASLSRRRAVAPSRAKRGRAGEGASRNRHSSPRPGMNSRARRAASDESDFKLVEGE